MYFESRIFDRFCAAFRYATDDTWGIVGQLEQQFDIRRGTIYRDCKRIQAILQSDRPGPKPDPTRPLLSHMEVLKAENAGLKTRVRELEAHLSGCVEVTPERIEDLVLTAVTTPPSYAGVGEYVAVANIVPRWGKSARVSPREGLLLARF